MKTKYFFPISLIVLLAFGFFSACNNENDSKLITTNSSLNTRTNDCYVNSSLPVGCTDSIKTRLVVIGACTLNVTYTIRKCSTGFTISNLGYTYTPGSACNAIKYQIDSLFVHGNYTAASNNLNQLFSFIMSNIENYELGFYTIPNCNAGLSITTNIISASCLKLCRYEDEGGFYIKEEICGSGCCTRFSYYCKNDDGRIIRTDSYGPTPVCDADNGICEGLISSSCTVNCARIIPK